MDEKTPNDKKPHLTFLQTVGMVLVAFFGVRSSRGRARDFARGNPGAIILVGFATVIVLALLLWLAVNLAIHYYTP